MRSVPLLFLALLAVAAPPAHADRSAEPSMTASALSTRASAALVEGSVLLLEGASELAVASVRTAGESTLVVMSAVVDGVSVSLTVALEGAGALALAAGEVLRVATTASGHLLIRGGEVLAFIPGQVGAALFHHERLAP